jgi:hypothetical protein
MPARQRSLTFASHTFVAEVADHVCSDHCRQFALLAGHGNFPRFTQQIVEGSPLPGNHVWKGEQDQDERRLDWTNTAS